jgi:hypothetical protein
VKSILGGKLAVMVVIDGSLEFGKERREVCSTRAVVSGRTPALVAHLVALRGGRLNAVKLGMNIAEVGQLFEGGKMLGKQRRVR